MKSDTPRMLTQAAPISCKFMQFYTGMHVSMLQLTYLTIHPVHTLSQPQLITSPPTRVYW